MYKVFCNFNLEKSLRNKFGEDFQLSCFEGQGFMTRDDLKESIKDVDGVILDAVKVDEELLKDTKNLKVVSTVSVGYNHFDIEEMKKRKILGTHTPNILNDSVADLVMGLMLSVARRIPELDRKVKEGRWDSRHSLEDFGLEVHGKKLGIIGLGRIGSVIAKRAKFGFDMEVSYYNRSRKEKVEKELDIVRKELDDLLKESDFIVLMVPLSENTKNFMDAEKFNKMKENAIFINASRGGTVVEKDLIYAIENKKIAGAGLDVFVKEPIEKDNPLLRFPNIVTLPHIGTSTYETTYAMRKMAVENTIGVLEGREIKGLIKEFK